MSPGARKLPAALQRWWLGFALIFALTFYGFWPSFFAALRETDVAHMIHGFSAIGWMVLTIVQAVLIRTRRRSWHRKLGYASLALAAVTVASGLQMIQVMVDHEDVPLLDIEFFYLDLTGLLLFAVLVWRAIVAARRRDIPLHLRLVACSAIIPLEAALERVFANTFPVLVPNYTVALAASLVFLECLLIVLIALEWWFRRVRWPFPLMLGYYAVMHVTAEPVAESPWFRAFVDWYAAI